MFVHGYDRPRDAHSVAPLMYSQLPETAFACVAVGVEHMYVVPWDDVHSDVRSAAVPRVAVAFHKQSASLVYDAGDALPLISCVGHRLHHEVGLHDTDATVALM